MRKLDQNYGGKFSSKMKARKTPDSRSPGGDYSIRLCYEGSSSWCVANTFVGHLRRFVNIGVSIRVGFRFVSSSLRRLPWEWRRIVIEILIHCMKLTRLRRGSASRLDLFCIDHDRHSSFVFTIPFGALVRIPHLMLVTFFRAYPLRHHCFF